MSFTHQHDNTTRLTARDRFKSGVIAEEKTTTEINHVVMKNGYSADGCGHGTRIEAVATLERIKQLYGLDVLDRVLGVTSFTWPGNKKAVSREMMVALAELLSRFRLPDAEVQATSANAQGLAVMVSSSEHHPTCFERHSIRREKCRRTRLTEELQ